MRLFVAVDLPIGLKDYLFAFASHLKTPAAQVSLARELHVTLKFLGDVDENKVDSIERRLTNVFFRPFQAKLSKVGTFDEPVKVVWGSVEPHEPFCKLAKEVDRALSEYKNDYPVYIPHITFCRVKKVIASEAFRELVDAMKLDQRMFEVSSFHLYQSIEGQEGHRYKIIRTYAAHVTKAL